MNNEKLPKWKMQYLKVKRNNNKKKKMEERIKNIEQLKTSDIDIIIKLTNASILDSK
jgi:hypothetical protein